MEFYNHISKQLEFSSCEMLRKYPQKSLGTPFQASKYLIIVNNCPSPILTRDMSWK